jgi:hypothetical protein
VTKILDGDSHSIFSLIKDKNPLSPHVCLIVKILRVDIFAVTSYTCDKFVIVLTCVSNHVANCSSCNQNI